MARRLRVTLLVVLAAAVAACAGVPATASAGTLDQQQPTLGSSRAFVESDQSDAQTFTAGISGGLDQADLGLSNIGTPALDLFVQIRDGSSTGAGNQILASRSLAPSSVTSTTAAFVPVTFNPPAPVVAGQQYAIVAYSAAPSPNNYAWWSESPGPYPGGASFGQATSPPSGSWLSNPCCDLAFKTYVVPTPPTPPTPPATGQRAAALASCKKRARKHNWSHKRLRKCKRKANLLPV